MKNIKIIKFEIKWKDGTEMMVGFVDKDKIRELLSGQGTLGEFLRDLVIKSIKVGDRNEEDGL